MSDLALNLIVAQGVPILFLVTFLSCLALPVPSSLMMLASGSFAAAGDIALAPTVAAALAGAILGDNLGYFGARLAGGRFEHWLTLSPKRARLRARAETLLDRWGASATFLSRWLVSPLGPYVNFVSGLSGFKWRRFFVWGALGEMVWVGLYVGLGCGFADQISAMGALLGNLNGLLAALVVAIGLGWWLWTASGGKNHGTAG